MPKKNTASIEEIKEEKMFYIKKKEEEGSVLMKWKNMHNHDHIPLKRCGKSCKRCSRLAPAQHRRRWTWLFQRIVAGEWKGKDGTNSEVGAGDGKVRELEGEEV